MDYGRDRKTHGSPGFPLFLALPDTGLVREASYVRSSYSGETQGRASATSFAVTCPCLPPK